jgi:cytochrome c biogenesis protein CcmG, thiol:disulfide interchange protein DsbE
MGSLIFPLTKRVALGLLAAIAVAGLVIAELVTSDSGKSARAAPPLPTQVLRGPAVDLASLRGRPALINFWASWCGPCKQEAPELERLARRLHGEARLVGVDWNDTTANATAFIRAHGLTYPNLRDGSSQVGNAFGLTGLPTTFVIDSQGRVVRTLRGPQTGATLREGLASVPSAGD